MRPCYIKIKLEKILITQNTSLFFFKYQIYILTYIYMYINYALILTYKKDKDTC